MDDTRSRRETESEKGEIVTGDRPEPWRSNHDQDEA